MGKLFNSHSQEKDLGLTCSRGFQSSFFCLGKRASFGLAEARYESLGYDNQKDYLKVYKYQICPPKT